ncbi:TonB-linked SusC/RagA family outer membrane protein [Sphingobacterium allocomposti]|uniref:TonB-linked SusC/RagA family outer membrane protein n=1 Tax=Sphingobacterium allocomposti TaxID=415956 RepID=A0A5S5DL62_9SPHI|nr:SusC/RagA family TonB-linked outer membrane protein [Sphingobacterium composti Yoo et al. 2007 non Ten et al. 2007]TYP96364.1 TonB-linked SusC/RagA family outer membrane protein [Sphingobacterium composti Yoo et al. 2007 non Ten et al. 2007]
MNKKKIAFLAAGLFFSAALFAQTQLRGRVVDEKGAPIVGVTLTLKDGTATQTGANGEFSITYQQAGPLTVSAVGYNRKQVNLSAETTLEIVLNPDSESLDEVVVTAMGISREKKSLGYTIQEVQAEELTKAGQLSVTGSLSGKVAGVQVNQFGGTVGASSRISLRGNSSVNADQQPLIVVDGIPISNDTQRSGDNTYSGVDYGSGINDINPEDIESVTVLKGGSAALYGMRAGNGVILITTKSGRKGQKGINFAYDGNYTIDQVSTLPKYQNLYGQGYNGDEYHFGLFGEGRSYQQYAQEEAFSYLDGTGNGIYDGYDESWGPRLDVGLKLSQFDSPIVNGQRQATDWISHPNNVRDFFQLGQSMNHNISMTAQSERSSTRASLSFRNQVGTVPNTDQKRYGAQLNTNMMLSEKFSYDISTSYTRTESDNILNQGYDGNNPMNGFIWFGRQVNLGALKNNWDQRDDRGDYTYYNWNTNYHVNPYFNIYENTNSYQRDRFFGKTSLFYQPYEFLKIEGRAGLDYYNAKTFERNYFNSAFPFGGFRNAKTDNAELNLDLIATFNKQLGDFNLMLLAGANYRNLKWDRSMLGADALTVLGVYTIANKSGDAITEMDHSHIRSNSVYASGSIGWKDQVYLDVSARNDWSSTIIEDFFYPSASLSWLPTTTFENLKSDILSFWKLRAGWAEIGAGTTAYRNRVYYYPQPQSFKGVAQVYKTMTYPNENLRPESIRTWEIGTEIGLFNDRLHADVVYYYKNTRDQILEVATSNTVGFNRMLLNAGEIENKGIELQLRGDILKKESGFNWSTTVNYAKDNSKIIELYPQLELNTYQVGWTWGIANQARKGERWGTLVGGGYDRVEEGSMAGAIKVNNRGLVVNKAAQNIGNVTPDFLASWRNDFRYNDFSFGFLLDLRVGGDIWSQTMNHSYVAGVAEITAENGIRERAIVAGRDVMTDERFAMQDADGNWVENTIETSAQTWYEQGGVSEMYVFDGSFLKLREAYLTYNVPSRYLQRLKGVSRVNFSLIGSNLALLWTHKSNTMRLDPETGGVSSDSRGVGFEQASVPTARSFGLKLGVTF